MKTIVISLGGSVLFSEESQPLFLQKLATLFKKISSTTKVYLVIGGGKVARDYISLGRSLGFGEETLDELGIAITRVNALLVAHLMNGTTHNIPHTIQKAQSLKHPLVVMGGTIPGHSTDKVGAELAKETHADLFVIATNVDGIYDKDPKVHPDVKHIKKISIDELIKLFGIAWQAAGKNTVVDGPALAIIKQAQLPTVVVNGKKLDQLEKALTGRSFVGTIISV